MRLQLQIRQEEQRGRRKRGRGIPHVLAASVAVVAVAALAEGKAVIRVEARRAVAGRLALAIVRDLHAVGRLIGPAGLWRGALLSQAQEGAQ